MTTLDIPASADVLTRFEKLVQSKRLAHAYLFIGAKYVGKSETAVKIAETMSSSVDTHILACDYGEKIKIDDIRQILGLVRLRPFNSEKKVIIIKNVELLTIESSNALLKTLEEPTSSSLILLTTSVAEKLLPTIISRCHRIYFPSPSKEFLAQQLKEHYHEDDLKAHFLGALSDGSLGIAQNYRERNLFELKNEWITQYVFGPQGDTFIKNYLKDKETTKEFLDVLLSWMRDALLIHSGISENELIHLDRKDELESFASQFSFDYLNDIYREVIKAQKMLAENLNIKLPLLIIKEKLTWAK